MADWIPQPTWTNGETVAGAKLAKHSQGITHVKERWDRAMVLTGSTDAAVGDLLVLDPSVTDGVALADTPGQAGPILVALEALDAGGVAGQVRAGGFVTINISDDVAKGDLVRVSSTGLGEMTSDASEAFGIATSADTAPGQVSVLMFPVGAGSAGGGGGGSGSNALWDPYGNAVVPVASAFSVHDHWSGSGILTRLDSNPDNIVFYNPAAVSTIERGIFVPTSVPSPPYTVTACLVPNLVEIDFAAVSLCLRNSSNDKRIILRIIHNTTLKLGDLYFDDYQTLTSGTGTPSGDLGWTQGFPIWLRFRDNASNLFYEYSRDGENWVIYQTKATGLHATMDQAGITMDSFTGGSGSAYSVAVLSFAILNTA
jgi:hypothetical protein